jgi:hypothetical protein
MCSLLYTAAHASVAKCQRQRICGSVTAVGFVSLCELKLKSKCHNRIILPTLSYMHVG